MRVFRHHRITIATVPTNKNLKKDTLRSIFYYPSYSFVKAIKHPLIDAIKKLDPERAVRSVDVKTI